jgi:hypothetical protein
MTEPTLEQEETIRAMTLPQLQELVRKVLTRDEIAGPPPLRMDDRDELVHTVLANSTGQQLETFLKTKPEPGFAKAAGRRRRRTKKAKKGGRHRRRNHRTRRA